MSDEKNSESATTMPTAAEELNEIFSHGDLLYWKCEYEKAKEHFQRALNQPSISLLDSARCYNSLGAADAKLQKYEEALNNYHKQLDILVKLKIPNEKEGDIVRCYMSIGMVYWLKHDYAAALDYHKRAHAALPTIAPAPDLVSNIYKNLANLFTKTNEFDLAILYFEKALEIDRHHIREDHLKFGQTYANIGAMYYSKEDYIQASNYFVKARETWLKSLPSSHIYIESMEKTICTVESKLVRMATRREPLQNVKSYNGEINRMIIIGITGGGKSSVGNTILGKKLFASKAATNSVTRTCQVGYRDFKNRHLLIVDTPGFLDTDEDSIHIEIGQSLQITVPGPHVFLIVLPFGRVTEEVEKAWTWISRIFGERALQYCVIVFTGLDNLNADDQTVDDFLKTRKPSLIRLMGRCGDRFVAFDNRGSNEEKNKTVCKLLDIIDGMMAMNNNQVFSNAQIEAISEVVEEETKKGSYIPHRSDGSIILLPQIEKIVLEAYPRKAFYRNEANVFNSAKSQQRDAIQKQDVSSEQEKASDDRNINRSSSRNEQKTE